ncbi:MAG: glucose/mannose-6-phosphate isomerase [Candidatus Woesearchaeota archaeon]|jgi:glucose/mannose-6-phosphate isomerase
MEFDTTMDKSNFKEILRSVHEQVEEGIELSFEKKGHGEFKNIVIVGMGGSGLPGRLLQNYIKNIPVYVVQEFAMQEFITKESLVFIISYSGNTAETVDIYRKIGRTGIQTIVISSGGKLEILAPMYKSPYIKIPTGEQPRMALTHMFFAMIGVLQNTGIIQKQDKAIEQVKSVLNKDTYDDLAKQLAEKIGNKTPIIYTSPKYSFVGYKWKISFNENAKRMAFCNVVPEVAHNELAAYQTANNHYYTIILKSANDHPQIKQRMDALKIAIKKSGNQCLEMTIRGEETLCELFSASYLADWVSYYCALAAGIDPTPVQVIEDFKKAL